jgi:tRNA modification GTPase
MKLLIDTDTIVARCTPQGSGAVALIRLSGDTACDIATRMSRLPNKQTLNTVSTHTVHYGAVIDAHGTTIDHVLYIVMHAPRTFTGQETVEITCHNNPFIVEAIIERAIACGARLAQNGEFTRRAVYNGKMDLVQAESLHEFIHAGTQQAVKAALSQVKGTLSQILVSLETALIKALALSEASFEFIDEEMQFGEQISTILRGVADTVQHLQHSCNAQQQIREGMRIALVGSVNVGKSSLFNALLGNSRAIVSDIPGTTRDVIETTVYRHDMHYTFVDTAGLRVTDDSIEKQGIERSHQEAHKADVVLIVTDGSRALSAQEQSVYDDLFAAYQSKAIAVRTKADLPPSSPNSDHHTTSASIPCISVSVITKQNLQQLEEMVFHKLSTLLHSADMPFLLNQRQQKLIQGLAADVHTIQQLLTGDIQYEIASYHLQQAIATVAELTGKSISEAAMDAVFREFCVGK